MPQGYVAADSDGNIWWYQENGEPPIMLTAESSLCGVKPLCTGEDDPFRNCCAWHDYAYVMRAFFEERGWRRDTIDDYFLMLMKQIAGEDDHLLKRAETYYKIVRFVGWIFYYRHTAYKGTLRATPDGDKECIQLLEEITNMTLM